MGKEAAVGWIVLFDKTGFLYEPENRFYPVFWFLLAPKTRVLGGFSDVTGFLSFQKPEIMVFKNRIPPIRTISTDKIWLIYPLFTSFFKHTISQICTDCTSTGIY